MRRILQFILKILAKFVLKKYKPMIIGITGSVGKTSTKEAVYTVLERKFKVRRNLRNYNNEIGVPLTILGLETAGKNIFKWMILFLKALKLILLHTDYPEILVLEMGADKPGDIKYLLDFVPVNIGIVTAIGEFPVHIEFFPEKDDLIEEKANMVKYLSPFQLPNGRKSLGIAILNYDDLSVREMRDKIKPGTELIYYGFGNGAKVKLSNFEVKFSNLKDFGASFKVELNGSIVPVRINALGKQHAYACGASISVGVVLGINLVEISQALKNYKVVEGRGNLIKGIKNTIIIDETYNASPAAALAALEVLEQFEGRRKIAVLGDMLELGEYTEIGHRRVGEKVTKVADMLFTVGKRAKFIAEEAKRKESKLSEENIFEFDSSEKAKKVIQEKIKSKDVILVKGSRAMRMEKIIEEIKEVGLEQKA